MPTPSLGGVGFVSAESESGAKNICMSEKSDVPQDQGQAEVAPPIVTVAEFDAVDFEAVLPDASKVDPYHLNRQFWSIAAEAKTKGQLSAARVFSLLASVCSIHLRPDDRADPWGPMLVLTDNRRSPIPSDFKGEQSTAFLAIIGRIKNPGLRARLADIAWTNDRKAAGSAAAIAVAAYQECANGLLAGTFKPSLQDAKVSIEVLNYVQRALAIAQATTKKDSKGRALFGDSLKATVQNLYAAAKGDKKYVVFLRTAELMLYYELAEAAAVAEDCEALAATNSNDFVMPIKSLWTLAADLHRQANDKEAEQRCRLASVQQTLAMRKQVSSSGAEAHWVQRALLELRHIEGQDDLEDSLLLELRRLQRESTREVSTFSFDIDVKEPREKIEARFEKLTLAEAMRDFAILANSKPIPELRKEALELLRKHPLQAMMAIGHIDQDGKSIAHSPGAETEGEQSEEWFRAQDLRSEAIRQQFSIAGWIEPARRIIHGRFLIEERHLEPIVMRSPFVPPSQAPVVLLGLTRYFQGDFISAAHLLISQLEPCLRYVLKQKGHDPVQLRDDGTEEEYDLNKMFTRMRPELVGIFGADWVYELDLLFVGRPGPSLRNELSHGHISAGACLHYSVLYGCWMMHRLCTACLLPYWDRITPELAALE